MADKEGEEITLWTKPETFWASYHESRPEYPKELYKIVFDYHGRHTSNTGIALDYGTGLGTVIPDLLERFDKVIGIDKNKEQLEMGRKMLQEKYGTERVEMVLESAEGYRGDQKASLIVAAEAVHWFNVDAWLKEAGQHLIKGGTIAFWFYPPRLVIQSVSELAQQILHEIVNELGRINYDKFGKKMKPVAAAILHQLDGIHLDEDVYEDEERHKWQHAEERKEVNVEEYINLAGSDPSRVGKNAKMFDHQVDSSGPFLQQKAWNIEQLVKYLDSLGTQIKMEDFLARDDIKVRIKTLENELGGVNCTFDVAWWFSLVMATKK